MTRRSPIRMERIHRIPLIHHIRRPQLGLKVCGRRRTTANTPLFYPTESVSSKPRGDAAGAGVNTDALL